MTKFLSVSIFGLLFGVALLACDPGSHHGADGGGDGGNPPGLCQTSRRPEKDYAKSQFTENKQCKVEIELPEKREWPPLNRPFDLLVRVSDKDGKADQDFAIQITKKVNGVTTSSYVAMMPEHGHGMDVAPQLVKVDKSTFKLKGMMFHMRGWWQITIQIVQGCGEPTKAVFNTFAEPPDIDPKVTQAKTDVKFSCDELRNILSLSPLPAVPPNPTNAKADDPKAAHLGQYLFYDKRLSLNPAGGGEISCATCHDPQKGWSDGRALSKGVDILPRNSPTLWNVAYNRWFFWDGRADSAWAQATKPIEADKEMNGNRYRILHLFATQDKDLKAAYEAIFGPLPTDVLSRYKFQDAKPTDDKNSQLNKNWESMSKEDQEKVNRFYSNITKAIAAYERKIISKDAPFDKFVAGLRGEASGDLKALSASAQRGLKLFIKRDSCITCHSGPNFTDNEFHNVGLPVNPKTGPDPDPVGRAGALTKVMQDLFNGIGPFSDQPSIDAEINKKLKYLPSKNPHATGQFKTPTLRSVATSAPYNRDGRFANLKEVVAFYSNFDVVDPSKCIKDGRASYIPVPGSWVKSQKKGECKIAVPELGVREEFMRLMLLSDAEINDLVEFLKSLTGKALPDALLKQPASPILK